MSFNQDDYLVDARNRLGVAETDRNGESDITPADDLNILGWTAFRWFRHKNKARVLIVILILNILIFSYMIYATTTKLNKANNRIMLISFAIVDAFLIFVLMKTVQHATIPFTSLNKDKHRYTGRACLKRLLIDKMTRYQELAEKQQSRLEMKQMLSPQELDEMTQLREEIKKLKKQNEELQSKIEKSQRGAEIQKNLPIIYDSRIGYARPYPLPPQNYTQDYPPQSYPPQSYPSESYTKNYTQDYTQQGYRQYV